jgi:hypothetical protein
MKKDDCVFSSFVLAISHAQELGRTCDPFCFLELSYQKLCGQNLSLPTPLLLLHLQQRPLSFGVSMSILRCL